eukprot:6198775-Alexandrium_andersonii.AAC.1
MDAEANFRPQRGGRRLLAAPGLGSVTLRGQEGSGPSVRMVAPPRRPGARFAMISLVQICPGACDGGPCWGDQVHAVLERVGRAARVGVPGPDWERPDRRQVGGSQ